MKRIFALHCSAFPGACLPCPRVRGGDGGKNRRHHAHRLFTGANDHGPCQAHADAEAGLTANDYTFAMEGTADAISPLLIQGELDAAMVPCNLAAVLINRTEGALEIAAINTLGVLYVVENGDTVQSVEDLRGKTIFSTGQGTTPEYAAGLRAFQKRH